MRRKKIGKNYFAALRTIETILTTVSITHSFQIQGVARASRKDGLIDVIERAGPSYGMKN